MKREISFTTDLLERCDWNSVDGIRKCLTPFGEIIEDQDGVLWIFIEEEGVRKKYHVEIEGSYLLIGDPDSDNYSGLLTKIVYDTFLDEIVDWIRVYRYLIFFVYAMAWVVEILSITRLFSVAISFIAILLAVHLEVGEKSFVSVFKSFAIACFIYAGMLFLIILISGVLFLTLGAMGIVYISEAAELLMGDSSILDFFSR